MKATMKTFFWKIGKKHPTSAVRTRFRVQHPIFCEKKDRLCLITRCVKFQQQNQFLECNANHLKKIIFNHLEGGWEGQNKSVPYMKTTSY